MKKDDKARIISELQNRFAKATGVVFTDYKGLTVKEISDLRRELRAVSMEYKIIKNTLARRAAEGTPIEGAKDVFIGPVGVALGYADPVLLAKKMLAFVKSNEKLKIKGGVIEGKTCRAEDIKTVSSLPPREVLLAMFVGAMQSPLSKLAGALNATMTQFAYAIEALKNKKAVNEQ